MDGRQRLGGQLSGVQTPIRIETLFAGKRTRGLDTGITVPWIPPINRGDQNRRRSLEPEALQTTPLGPDPRGSSHGIHATDRVIGDQIIVVFFTEPTQSTARRQSSEETSRSSDRAKVSSRSRSLSQSRQGTSNLLSASQSSHRHTPTSSADTLALHLSHNALPPLPVPSLPQSPQKSFMPAEHASSSRFNSITEPSDAFPQSISNFTGRAY